MRTLIILVLLVDAVHAEDRVRELLKQKEAVLSELVDLAAKAYRAGAGDITELLRVQRKLVEVRLELAKTKEERVALLQRQVALAKTALNAAESGFQAAVAPKSDVLIARAALLDAEIRLAREKPAEKVGWGHLRGKFVFDGEPPQARPVRVTKDIAYFSKFNLVDESLVVGKDQGLANVLVYLCGPGKSGKPPRIHKSYNTEKDAILECVGGQFHPRIVVMRTGRKILLKNPNPLGVNVHYTAIHNAFNVMLAPNQSLKQDVKQVATPPWVIKDAVHAWMLAYGIVLDHPYSAVSAKEGTFEIRNLPSGELEFQLWHEKCGYVKVKPANERGRVKVAIQPGETTDLGIIRIPPSVLLGEEK